MFGRKRRPKSVDSLASLVKYVYPQCKAVLKVPCQAVRDFSPGGKEYHKGSEASFVCIKCGAMIPVDTGSFGQRGK